MCIPSIGTMDSLPARPVFYDSMAVVRKLTCITHEKIKYYHKNVHAQIFRLMHALSKTGQWNMYHKRQYKITFSHWRSNNLN